MKKLIALIAFIITLTISAQTGVGINTSSPDSSSALDISSTNKGLLIPRMTEEQRIAINPSATAKGLMVYQIDEVEGFYYYDGIVWTTLQGIAGPQGPAGNIAALEAGKLLVGDFDNVPLAVSMSADATIASSGAVTISNDAITTVKLLDTNVTNAKLDKTNIPLSGFGEAVANVALGANKLTGVLDPTQDQDAATKKYVDELIAALEARIVALETVPVLPAVGDFRDGGVVFYVSPTPTDLNGDGILDIGLVCAVEDQSASFVWYDDLAVFNSTGTSIGSGAENSANILLNIFGTNSAVYLASQYAGGGFNDWFLPSRDELSAIYTHRNIINISALANSGSSLSNGSYWSSSLSDILADSAWLVNFASGNPFVESLFQFYSIRAVRVF